MIPVTVPVIYALTDGGLTCGRNEGTPVIEGYAPPFALPPRTQVIELALRGSLRGRPVEWTTVDRIILREGVIAERRSYFAERRSYFDPLPLLQALLSRPRAAVTLMPLLLGRKQTHDEPRGGNLARPGPRRAAGGLAPQPLHAEGAGQPNS